MTDRGLIHLTANRQLHNLNASDTRISDAGLIEFLPKFREFIQDGLPATLYLKNDQISDKAVPGIERLNGLAWLDLRNTRLTDRGLIQLAGIKSLNEIAVSGSLVTAQGIARFKQLNHRARIVDKDVNGAMHLF
jgi:hypothetical protein